MCYLGGGIYKEIAPKYTGEPVKFGSKKNFTVTDAPQSALKDPLSSDLNVGHPSDHDEAQQPSNDTQCNGTDLAGIEDLQDTGIPQNADISEETPSVENQDGPSAVDSDEPPVQNRDGPSSIDNGEPPVQNRDGPSSIDEPPVQNHAALLEQDNESASDVSTQDKKDSNNINPVKDGSENQTDATQHEVSMNETETKTDNKIPSKIVMDPAVEHDLHRQEAIVTLTEFYKENPQYKNNSSVIDAEDSDDSSSTSVGPEPDGWEPEANRKRRKRNTKVIPTNSGQLAV